MSDIELDDYIYSDVGFKLNRTLHIKKTIKIGLLLIALNAIWGGFYAYQNHVLAMVYVNSFGTVVALIILAIAQSYKNITVSILAHSSILLAFLFVWSFLVVIEGLPATSFPTLNHWWFIATAMAAFLLFVDSIIWRSFYLAVAFISFVIWDIELFTIKALSPLPPEAAKVMYPVLKTGVHIGVFVMVLLLSAVFITSIAQAERQLGIANQNLETLLGNMLPKSISDRLRTEGKTFADGHAECTVLFVDIVGFTTLTTQIPPEELVSLLNKIFTRFDELTEEMGLEKIKTIGDAYMVAAGLPKPRTDHAKASILLALKMREAIREYSNLKIRIGINSGNVIAGIIGKRKFIYDLWGDTVNIASRMESHGIEDEIQVSESTAALIKDEFILKERGEIEIKGLGKKSVYLVVEALSNKKMKK